MMVKTVNKDRKLVWIFLVVLLLPFFSITTLSDSIEGVVSQTWQVVTMVFFAFLVCVEATRIKFSGPLVCFALYELTVLGSTFLNRGFSPGILVTTVTAMLLFILLQSSYYEEILRALVIIVTISVLINFPIMLSRLDQINPKFFIGGKNALGMFLIPGAFLLLINAYTHKEKAGKGVFLGVALCLLSVFIGASGTGIVVSIITLMLILLSMKIKPRKWLCLVVILAFYALFVLFSDDFFLTEQWILFTDMLGKDNTLTARSTIWRIAKEYIGENWLFGVGRGAEIAFIDIWEIPVMFNEAHNFILEILMEGGAVALTLYALFFGGTVYGLDMNDKKDRTVFIALCVVLINGLTESNLNNFFVTILLGIACRYSQENKRKRITDEQPT